MFNTIMRTCKTNKIVTFNRTMFASNIYILCTIFNDFFVKVLAQIEFCLKFLDNIWEGI